jgi:hypothetical protein
MSFKQFETLSDGLIGIIFCPLFESCLKRLHISSVWSSVQYCMGYLLYMYKTTLATAFDSPESTFTHRPKQFVFKLVIQCISIYLHEVSLM